MKNSLHKSLFVVFAVVSIAAKSIYAQWSFVGALNGTDAIYGMVMNSNKNIYVGGDFRNTAFNRYVAVWNGTDWDSCGIATWNPGGQIRGMAIDTLNNVYTSWVVFGGGRQVQKWDGTSWTILGALKANDEIKVLHVDKNSNKLYAAGRFSVSSQGQSVARWDGNKWDTLPQIAISSGEIIALTTDKNGNLYAAGEFKNANNKFYVAKYDGSTWTELGAPGNELNAGDRIRALHVDAAGNIYAGGGFKNANNKTYVAKWNGSSWTDIGLGVTNTSNNDIYAIASDAAGNLYVGGEFYNISNSLKYIAYYNGSWSELGGTGALTSVLRVEDLIIDGCDVYASGAISNTGGYQVIKYTCISTNINENITEAIKLYPNPVSEGFTILNVKVNNLKIYNSLGQIVNINFEKENKYFDVSNLNKGIYFVQIETENETIIKKIIKN